jgi:hypothetical protein
VRRGEESDRNGKNGQEFHDVIRRRSNTTPGVSFKMRVLPVEMKGNLVHAFLLAGPV